MSASTRGFYANREVDLKSMGRICWGMRWQSALTQDIYSSWMLLTISTTQQPATDLGYPAYDAVLETCELINKADMLWTRIDLCKPLSLLQTSSYCLYSWL
jgi:hypothetical protein